MARFPARPTEGPCERSGESPDEVMCEGTGARSPAPDEGTRNPSHTPFVTRDRGPEGRRTSVARKGANRESDRRVTRVARFRSVASRRAVRRSPSHSPPFPSPVTTDRPSLAPYVGRSCRYASAATRTGSVRPKGPFHGRTGPAARSEENVDNERSRKADMETDDSRHSHG